MAHVSKISMLFMFSDSKRRGGRGRDQEGKEEPPHSFHPSQEPTILVTGVYKLLQMNGREAVPPPYMITSNTSVLDQMKKKKRK